MINHHLAGVLALAVMIPSSASPAKAAEPAQELTETVERADRLRNEYLYEEAIREYTKALEIDSSSVDAYLGRGITQTKLDANESAQMDFERALELETRNPKRVRDTLLALGTEPARNAVAKYDAAHKPKPTAGRKKRKQPQDPKAQEEAQRKQAAAAVQSAKEDFMRQRFQRISLERVSWADSDCEGHGLPGTAYWFRGDTFSKRAELSRHRGCSYIAPAGINDATTFCCP